MNPHEQARLYENEIKKFAKKIIKNNGEDIIIDNSDNWVSNKNNLASKHNSSILKDVDCFVKKYHSEYNEYILIKENKKDGLSVKDSQKYMFLSIVAEIDKQIYDQHPILWKIKFLDSKRYASEHDIDVKPINLKYKINFDSNKIINTISFADACVIVETIRQQYASISLNPPKMEISGHKYSMQYKGKKVSWATVKNIPKLISIKMKQPYTDQKF
jgi:hypothetical protein